MWVLGAIGLVALAFPAAAHGADVQGASSPGADLQVLRLASLEWLPYVGRQLPEDGLSGAIAAAVGRQFGHDVRIDYFPWKRAMQVGGEEPGYAGFFPAYYTEERASRCYFSQPMGRSTIGLAYLKAQPLKFHRLADLEGVTIGVVAGYSNGRAFDDMLKAGRLTVDTSPADAFNLRKLLAGRVRAAVIDRTVMRYLLLTDPVLAPDRDRIAFHDNVLAELNLHVCFRRNRAGLDLQQQFDAVLKHFDLEKFENGYFQRLEAAGRPSPR